MYENETTRQDSLISQLMNLYADPFHFSVCFAANYPQNQTVLAWRNLAVSEIWLI